MSHVAIAVALLAAAVGGFWWWTYGPFFARSIGRVHQDIAPSESTAPPTSASPAWEAKIDVVLDGNSNDETTARRLIELLPSLPEDGQIAAAHHICDLLDDKDYRFVRPLLLDTKLPEAVLTVLFSDLMNRRDTVKLHTLIDVAKVPDHPFREEALSDLEVYAEHDYDTDFMGWSAAVEKYLRENPEGAGKL